MDPSYSEQVIADKIRDWSEDNVSTITDKLYAAGYRNKHARPIEAQQVAKIIKKYGLKKYGLKRSSKQEIVKQLSEWTRVAWISPAWMAGLLNLAGIRDPAGRTFTPRSLEELLR